MTQATAGLDAATVRDIRTRQREEYKAALARVVELEESLRSLGDPNVPDRFPLDCGIVVELTGDMRESAELRGVGAFELEEFARGLRREGRVVLGEGVGT